MDALTLAVPLEEARVVAPVALSVTSIYAKRSRCSLLDFVALWCKGRRHGDGMQDVEDASVRSTSKRLGKVSASCGEETPDPQRQGRRTHYRHERFTDECHSNRSRRPWFMLQLKQAQKNDGISSCSFESHIGVLHISTRCCFKYQVPSTWYEVRLQLSLSSS